MFRKHRAAIVRRYRPILQVLEARHLLSTYVVDHLADDWVGTGLNGSLRYCLTNAVDGDTITFGVTGTINLTDALPDLAYNISIQGPGPSLLTVRGGAFFRIFTVPTGATVSISGLTITNGYADDFGGGIANAGTLTLSNSTISGNTVNTCPVGCSDSPDSPGGGIFNGNASGTAVLTITNSTISGNAAGPLGQGGGIANGLQCSSYTCHDVPGGTVTVSNSTVSDNEADNDGGGISNVSPSGRLNVTNSTIARNGAGSLGGGIYCRAGGTATISNSTIAGNGAVDAGGGITCAATLRNTIRALNSDDPATGHIDANYNLIGGDPLLGLLQDNGGPTQTMAVLAGSPALNAGDPAQLGVADQRGVVRTGGVNIGAYQASASALLLTVPATVTAGMPFDVSVTAVDPFGQPALGYTGTVTFSTSDRDPSVVLPADYTFTASDQGTHTFSGDFTLITLGDQVLTATDAAGGFSTSAGLTVQGGGSPTAGHRRTVEGADGFLAALAEGEAYRLPTTLNHFCCLGR